MLENLFVFLKGILFGASNLIPGMSGGTMLVITNIYEKLLDSVSNIFKKFKSVILFLILFAIGAVIGILVAAKGINKVVQIAPFPAACFFAGIVLGGVPLLAKPVIQKINWKYIIAFIAGAICVIGLMVLGKVMDTDTSVSIFSASFGFKDYLLLFLAGFIGCFAMLLPGVSGVLMLVIFNYYNLFMDALANLTKFSQEGYLNVLLIIIPVGLGIVAGLIPSSKILSWMFKKFPTGSYFAILGFVLASIAVIFVNVDYSLEGVTSPLMIGLGCGAFPLGFALSFLLSKLKDRKGNTPQKEDSESKAIEEAKEEENAE